MFKALWDADAPLSQVLPSLYAANGAALWRCDDPQRVPRDA